MVRKSRYEDPGKDLLDVLERDRRPRWNRDLFTWPGLAPPPISCRVEARGGEGESQLTIQQRSGQGLALLYLSVLKQTVCGSRTVVKTINCGETWIFILSGRSQVGFLTSLGLGFLICKISGLFQWLLSLPAMPFPYILIINPFISLISLWTSPSPTLITLLKNNVHLLQPITFSWLYFPPALLTIWHYILHLFIIFFAHCLSLCSRMSSLPREGLWFVLGHWEKCLDIIIAS